MSDLIQRAAAIVGVPSPNSDQLAAWLGEHGDRMTLEFDRHGWFGRIQWSVRFHPGYASGTLLDCLAAAVVEVDRIEREAAK